MKKLRRHLAIPFITAAIAVLLIELAQDAIKSDAIIVSLDATCIALCILLLIDTITERKSYTPSLYLHIDIRDENVAVPLKKNEAA